MSVWRQFNSFLLKLDVMPPTWEQRTVLYIAFLIEGGRQYASVKSYVSAIKRLLTMINYEWKDNSILLNSMTRACKLINDRVKTRLPIHANLLEMILFEVERLYAGTQWYLEKLYKALFAMCYYGLMRVGEVTLSPHVLKVKDVHIALNKDKILLILYTSKAHDMGTRPQKIKITSNRTEKTGSYFHRHFCPFEILRNYLKLRGGFDDEKEQFFVFRDKSPVRASQVSLLLKKIIGNFGLQQELYSMHSFRIGRTSDLIKFNYPLDEVQRIERWKSNTVLKYIRS